jgi:hypothetical protein
MAYADYEFYESSFFGSKIPRNDFLYFAARASEYLDSLIFPETDEITLANACCTCAEILYSAQQEKQITSEKVGDYSVSYAANQTVVADELRSAAARYLKIRSVGWV